MKKILYLSIPILVPGFLLILFLLYAKQQPPAWQTELEKYIAYKEHASPILITEQSAVRSERPWKFTGDTGYIVYGDTPYYITDNTYQSGRDSRFSRMPLPYPPEELWCVLLKMEPRYAPDFFKYQLVFVARHQDLYNADWVIHEANRPPSSPEIKQTLSRIGCNIDASQQQKNFVGGL
jgi:hypothetical protein